MKNYIFYREKTIKFGDLLLREYRSTYKDIISELKDVLKERVNKIEQSLDRLPVMIERESKLAY